MGDDEEVLKHIPGRRRFSSGGSNIKPVVVTLAVTT